MSLKSEVSELAIQTATDILLPDFARVKATHKQDGSLLTQADINAHNALSSALPEIADYPVLSEEMSAANHQDIVANESASYWCIDPLDGTSNFTVGIPYWCISIALIEEGQLSLGVVYDPNRDECFAATSTTTTTLNGIALSEHNQQINTLKQCMGMVDFKRLDHQLSASILEDPPYHSQRSFGAIALDYCWLADNRGQLYLHGKQKLWDYSAGLLILQQASGAAETFDGDRIFQNDLQLKSVLAATNNELFDQWRTYFQSISIN